MKIISNYSQVNTNIRTYLIYSDNNRLETAYIRAGGFEGEQPYYLWYDVDDFVFLDVMPPNKFLKWMRLYFDGRDCTVIASPELELGIVDKSIYKLNKNFVKNNPKQTSGKQSVKKPISNKSYTSDITGLGLKNYPEIFGLNGSKTSKPTTRKIYRTKRR